MKIKLVCFAVLGIVLAAYPGIAAAQQNGADSWDNDRGREPPANTCRELDQSLYAPVPIMARLDAIEKLARVSALQLGESQAEKMLGAGPEPEPSRSWFGVAQSNGRKPYLVRAVAKGPVGGIFSVSLCGKTLSIVHGSLGRSTPPTELVPLVVFLSHRPSRVSAGWRMAE
jgi:hypothetical protein